MSVSDQVLSILMDITDCEDIGHDLDIRLYDEHLLDSLATVQLILAFNEAFGIDIAPTAFDLEQWATPRQMITFVEQATE